MFKFSGKPKHIQPPVEATNFSRTMVELGIQQIFARSPQAQGRVERMTRTFAVKLHPFHDCPAPQRQSGVSPVQQRVDSGGASVYGVAPHSDLHRCRR